MIFRAPLNFCHGTIVFLPDICYLAYGMKKLLLTLSAFFILLVQAYARPVHNRLVTLTQKDGSIITAMINGDEFSHTIKDLEGHTLVKDSDGNWCYASYSPDGTAYSSGYCVGEKAPAHVLNASKSAPMLRIRREDRRRLRDERLDREPRVLAGGEPLKRHCMILLVDFKDKKMSYSREDFEKLVRQKGYSLYGASGSVNDYFNDQFRGDIEFSYEISDIITLDHDCAWYFANENGEDKRPDHAVAEACLKASSAGVDFSSCDDDGDGEAVLYIKSLCYKFFSW